MRYVAGDIKRDSAHTPQADFRQPNFKEAFYGRNYDDLLAIKAKYDPFDMFYARTAVGSDRWYTKVDGHLCRTSGHD